MKLQGEGSLIAQQEAKEFIERIRIVPNGIGDVWVMVDHPDLEFKAAFTAKDGHIGTVHLWRRHSDLIAQVRLEMYPYIFILAMTFILGFLVGKGAL